MSGRASLRMGEDGTFDKPVLLIEGFDFEAGWDPEAHGFGGVTWSGIFGGQPLEFPAGLQYRPLLDELYAMGGDVIYLDFEQGTASLEDKTALALHVLELIQSTHEGQAPGIVVGVSMGGVVARMALAQWEMTQTPHCIGAYFSVDAPHLGATLPVGLQALVLGLSSYSEQGQALWQALNSSAGHQLTRHHISNSSDHLDTQVMLDDLGWPQASLNLCIANSQTNGTANLSDDPLLVIQWGLGDPVNANLCFVEADRWDETQSHLGATYALPGPLWTASGWSGLEIGSLSFPRPLTDDSNLPGSTSTHLLDLAEALKESIPLDVTEESIQSGVTFVPFGSAVGGDTASFTPWTDCSTALTSNPREPHASLAAHHRAWMLSWVNAVWDNSWISDLSSSSVTIGWNAPHRRLVHPAEVSSTGVLSIGNTNDLFAVKTSPCGGEILVKTGGELRTGQSTGAAGRLDIFSGTAVRIGPGGIGTIHASSSIHVDQGGELTIDGGTMVVKHGGVLHIHPEGRLELQNGATLVLEEGGELLHEGTWVVPDGHHVSIDNQGTLVLSSHSTGWIGAEGSISVDMAAGGDMLCNGESVWSGSGRIHLSGGQLNFGSTGTWTVHNRVHLEDMTLHGTPESDVHFKTSGHVKIDACQAAQWRWHHNGASTSSSLVHIQLSQWSESNAILEHAQVRANNNHWEDAYVHVSHGVHPSRFVANEWTNPWHSSSPALSLHHVEGPLWVERNRFLGGKGTFSHNSSPVFACNLWSGSTQALTLHGDGAPCFTPSCGGGGNVWQDNDVHLMLDDAPLPFLHSGNNHFGHVHQHVAAGTTSTNAEQWTIQHTSWDVSLLSNPWLSDIPSAVEHCDGVYCHDVPWMASSLAIHTPCNNDNDPRPARQKISSAPLNWNVLGQEIRSIAGAKRPLNFSFNE